MITNFDTKYKAWFYRSSSAKVTLPTEAWGHWNQWGMIGIQSEHWVISIANLYLHMSHFAYACKMRVPSTLCWKIGKISSSTKLFGFNFADNNLKLPNLLIHAFVILQKLLEIH